MNNWSLFVLLPLFIYPTLQDCVWYGECNEILGRRQNCPYPKGKPLKFKNSKSLQILQSRCPKFIEKVPEQKFCCDDEQVETLQRNMDLAANLFKRCPTCIANLNLHICHLTCSPNQTDFLQVLEQKENGNKGGAYISKISLYLSKKYKEITYDSCKEVTVPSSGEKAMTLACGVWGAADQCTAERWFAFFGDFDNNIMAPFDIEYDPPLNDLFKTLEIKVLPCNESYANQKACSCSDCEASCIIPFEHPGPPQPFSIAGLNGVQLIITIWVTVSAVVLVLLVRHHRSNTNDLCSSQITSGSAEEKLSCLKKFGSKTDTFLTVMFNKWGTFCARNPVLIFAISSWVIAALGYGIYNLKITTDPTKIWASPTCKTRLDKNYFDSRFTPFYRTNQIFIKAKGLKSFTWKNSDNFTYHFGPAFNPQFLEEVYKLQMSIQQESEFLG